MLLFCRAVLVTIVAFVSSIYHDVIGESLITNGIAINDTRSYDNLTVIGSVTVRYKNQSTTRRPWKEAALKENGTCADGSGTLIAVGRKNVQLEFNPLYSVCHDKLRAVNYYTKHTIEGRALKDIDRTHKRPFTFSQSNYYPGLNVHQLYSVINQTDTIGIILNSTALVADYINSKKQLFLSRGHLAPDGDFVDADSQDATYYFLNTAPQWQTFNGGNWNSLEVAIRKQALVRDLHLTVYTGTFGILTLPDANNIHQPIFLAFDENNNGLIPVPKYYWKVLHHRDNNTATAVIGINNPYAVVRPEDIFCPNVCSQIPWINWKLTDTKKGFTFCCNVKHLHEVVPHAPDLDLPLFV